MIFHENLAVGSVGCVYLIKETRKTRNKYTTLKEKYDAMIKVTCSEGLHIFV